MNSAIECDKSTVPIPVFAGEPVAIGFAMRVLLIVCAYIAPSLEEIGLLHQCHIDGKEIV